MTPDTPKKRLTLDDIAALLERANAKILTQRGEIGTRNKEITRLRSQIDSLQEKYRKRESNAIRPKTPWRIAGVAAGVVAAVGAYFAFPDTFSYLQRFIQPPQQIINVKYQPPQVTIEAPDNRTTNLHLSHLYQVACAENLLKTEQPESSLGTFPLELRQTLVSKPEFNKGMVKHPFSTKNCQFFVSSSIPKYTSDKPCAEFQQCDGVATQITEDMLVRLGGEKTLDAFYATRLDEGNVPAQGEPVLPHYAFLTRKKQDGQNGQEQWLFKQETGAFQAYKCKKGRDRFDFHTEVIPLQEGDTLESLSGEGNLDSFFSIIPECPKPQASKPEELSLQHFLNLGIYDEALVYYDDTNLVAVSFPKTHADRVKDRKYRVKDGRITFQELSTEEGTALRSPLPKYAYLSYYAKTDMDIPPDAIGLNLTFPEETISRWNQNASQGLSDVKIDYFKNNECYKVDKSKNVRITKITDCDYLDDLK